MESYHLEYDTYHIANFIQHEAKDHLTEDIFFSSDSDELYSVFDRFYGQELFFYSNIMRIKVWNENGTIIYSDNTEIIGQDHNSNENFQKAMSGEIISESGKQDDEDNEGENTFYELTEIYIPIKFDNGKIVGVIEVYKSLTVRDEYLKKFKERYLMLIGVLIILAIFSVYFFKKDLEKQLLG